ncbi:hypothetical protein [Roseivirga spongicola]|uniref:Outer membrane protein beta-barrel domain-containing protein n=2 Tax=Roseivirga spongicola TaxID=333140 RepID=A0A150XGI6_9BACT|nr:hypothetical protein [Roseivirga spongicola]KYG77825.1 hypothetical protein AWW68_03390 [Roseivirga spongicola]WPZ11552.1 hypothetical protein T7867_05465 [Roseivirga spongicola]
MLEISVLRRSKFRLRYINLAFILSFVAFQTAMAQGDQSSYSALGVGSLNWSGFAQNEAMGGLGVGYNTKYFYNDLNPALLGANYEAVFQLGTTVDYRNITNGSDSYSTVSGGFKEFAMSAPLVYGKWNLGISLSPYTSVNYGFTQVQTGPEGGDTNIDVTGRGGIDQANLVTSFKIGDLSIGLKGTYYFGIINNEDKFTLTDINSNFATTIVNERRSFGQLAASAGLYYNLNLSNNKRLNFGAYYNPGFNLRQERLVTFENETPNGTTTSTDTLAYNKDESLYIPEKMGFGISYEKFRSFAVGLDVQFQNWRSYRNYQGSTESYYGNAIRVALGTEYIPNAEQPTKLINVTSFRFGIHYEKTPFLISNEVVNDFGINFGVSVPLSSFWGLSHLNVGATLGQRGNISTTGLVRENYVKLNLGFSLQDITWFSKQRFN